jgi:uncharacterized PurR-regulated membrane protein YhhQ (DUF165 family)
MDTAQPPAIARSIFFFSIFYGGMVCIAGVLGNKQVALGPLAVEAGIFAFLLLVVTSSAVAELFGREVANRLVIIGFVPLIASMLLAYLVLALPAAKEMPVDRLAAFETSPGPPDSAAILAASNSNLMSECDIPTSGSTISVKGPG